MIRMRRILLEVERLHIKIESLTHANKLTLPWWGVSQTETAILNLEAMTELNNSRMWKPFLFAQNLSVWRKIEMERKRVIICTNKCFHTNLSSRISSASAKNVEKTSMLYSVIRWTIVTWFRVLSRSFWDGTASLAIQNHSRCLQPKLPKICRANLGLWKLS